MDMMEIRRRVLTGQKSGGGLPSGYVQYDYIEATNNLALIDTGITAASDLKIQFHAYIDRANGRAIIGMNGGADSNDYRYFAINGSEYFDQSSARINRSTTSPPMEVYREVGNFYIKDLASGNVIVDGAPIEWSIASNVYIGCSVSMLGDRFYMVKIYKSGKLVRDFIPVYSVSDDQYGVFDTVNQEFHGHDNFIGGNNT